MKKLFIVTIFAFLGLFGRVDGQTLFFAGDSTGFNWLRVEYMTNYNLGSYGVRMNVFDTAQVYQDDTLLVGGGTHTVTFTTPLILDTGKTYLVASELFRTSDSLVLAVDTQYISTLDTNHLTGSLQVVNVADDNADVRVIANPYSYLATGTFKYWPAGQLGQMVTSTFGFSSQLDSIMALMSLTPATSYVVWWQGDQVFPVTSGFVLIDSFTTDTAHPTTVQINSVSAGLNAANVTGTVNWATGITADTIQLYLCDSIGNTALDSMILPGTVSGSFGHTFQNLSPGTTYMVKATGDGVSDTLVFPTTPGTASVLITQAAGNIRPDSVTASAAVLWGTGVSTGDVTLYLCNAAGNTVLDSTLFIGVGDTTVAGVFAGLTPATTYTLKSVAQPGNVNGGTVSFTTDSVPAPSAQVVQDVNFPLDRNVIYAVISGYAGTSPATWQVTVTNIAQNQIVLPCAPVRSWSGTFTGFNLSPLPLVLDGISNGNENGPIYYEVELVITDVYGNTAVDTFIAQTAPADPPVLYGVPDSVDLVYNPANGQGSANITVGYHDDGGHGVGRMGLHMYDCSQTQLLFSTGWIDTTDYVPGPHTVFSNQLLVSDCYVVVEWQAVCSYDGGSAFSDPIYLRPVAVGVEEAIDPGQTQSVWNWDEMKIVEVAVWSFAGQQIRVIPVSIGRGQFDHETEDYSDYLLGLPTQTYFLRVRNSNGQETVWKRGIVPLR